MRTKKKRSVLKILPWTVYISTWGIHQSWQPKFEIERVFLEAHRQLKIYAMCEKKLSFANLSVFCLNMLNVAIALFFIFITHNYISLPIIYGYLGSYWSAYSHSLLCPPPLLYIIYAVRCCYFTVGYFSLCLLHCASSLPWLSDLLSDCLVSFLLYRRRR